MRREAGRPSISILKLQLLPKAADVPAPVIRRFQFVEPLSELLFERLAGTIASGNANMEVLEALHGRAVGTARSKPPLFPSVKLRTHPCDGENQLVCSMEGQLVRNDRTPQQPHQN